MSSKEELDNSIVDAIDTYKAAKREELVKAVEDAKYARDNAMNAEAAASRVFWHAAEADSKARKALRTYDKENT